MKTIIELAEEAGFEITHNMILVKGWEINPYMQRFAALVLANTDPQSSMAWQEGNEAGRLSEREAILELADSYADADMPASMVANAIRARGDT